MREDRLPQGTILVATTQSAGQGQYGRSWQSLSGNLHLSLLLYPCSSPDQMLPLTLTLVWGVAAELRSQFSLPVRVKWPNDLVLEGRKLGGLLLQTRSSGAQVRVAVAGLGVNVNAPVPELGICLREVVGHRLDLARVTAAVLQGLEQGYQVWQEAGWQSVRSQFHSWMDPRHQQVHLPDQTPVTVLGVASTGALQVETQRGMICLEPGQIKLGYSTLATPSS